MVSLWTAADARTLSSRVRGHATRGHGGHWSRVLRLYRAGRGVLGADRLLDLGHTEDEHMPSDIAGRRQLQHGPRR